MKSCIIYTVKDEHLTQLGKSLALVHTNLLPVLPEVDFIFFTDNGTEKLDDLKKICGITNKFIYKKFDIKPNVQEIPSLHGGYFYSTTYKNICRFWAGEIFLDKDVGCYDYYLRLDCDSYITDKVPYNPFEFLANEGKFYAYLKGGLFQDCTHVVVGLRDALRQFELSYDGKIFKSCMEFPDGALYYTNFEIVKISAFRDSDYMKLYRHLDKLGGIYKYRWGDAPIRYAGINMLMGGDGVSEISDIKYTHQHFVNGVFR